MKKLLVAAFLALFTFTHCTSTSLNDRLIGTWDMHQVIRATTDVSSEHNPAGNRFIAFKTDNTFESDGDPYGKNTGRWSIDEDKGILYLDSDVDDDDSEWNIILEGTTMTWTGRGDPGKEAFKLVHKRQ